MSIAIIIRLGLAVVAYNLANQSEKPLVRALGLAYLLIVGFFAMMGAFSNGGWQYWLVGLVTLGAAAHAYWTNR